jgi:hypothetical protein
VAALEHHGAGTRRIVEDVTARVDAACLRFRPDSELALLPVDGLPVPVSPLLAELVTTGLPPRSVRRATSTRRWAPHWSPSATTGRSP